MNKKLFFPIIIVIMLFTLGTPALAGTFPSLSNASFDYWNGGTLDDWTVSTYITAQSHTGSDKVNGNASLYVPSATLNSEAIYQAAGGLSLSAMYTVSASVKDAAGDSTVKLCIDQTGAWNADETTCSSESTGAGSFETIQVSTSTDGSGDLGYIFFEFSDPNAFLTLNQKPTGDSVIIQIYIDNVVISPDISEFSAAFPIMILSVSIFVIGMLVYKKKRI